MKKKLCLPALGICSALAVWCFTGCGDQTAETQNNTNNNPNPAWAVPGTDILIVADRLTQEVPNQAAWEALQKKYQALAETAGVASFPEELQPLLKATLGMTPEGEMPTLRHVTCAMTLPKTVTAFSLFDQDQWPEDLGLYCFVGYPEANLDEVNKAVEKLLADNPGEGLNLEKNGQWSVLASADPEDAKADPFCGWKSIAGGYTLILCDTQATADRAVDNTEVPAADSPLAKAFQAPSEAGPWCKLIVRDVADLMNRYVTSPTDRQEVMLNAPFLFQTHALTLTVCYNPDGNSRLTIEANADSEKTAGLMRDQLIALKMMARQMMVTQSAGAPDAEPFITLIDSVACEAKGSVATLTVTVTPAQAEALLDLCVATQSALASGPSGDPFADDEPYFGTYE